MISFIFSIILIIFQIGKFGNKLNINAKVNNDYTKAKSNIFKTDIENNVHIKERYENKTENFETIEDWKIRIPKIALEAKIKNGTTSEILDEFVGHFEETQKQMGNVGLAAHNRGYNVNYFEKIKMLEIGDEIYYSYNGIEKTYIVSDKNIIKDTDWKWLENTKDNRITLITCVENEPKYRLCIQGKEKEK